MDEWMEHRKRDLIWLSKWFCLNAHFPPSYKRNKQNFQSLKTSCCPT